GFKKMAISLNKYGNFLKFFLVISCVYLVCFMPQDALLLEILVDFTKFQVVAFLYSSFLCGLSSFLNFTIWK
ncbi:hypothetical protein NNO85_15320, partial [Acinetobacter baumannii]